MSTPKSGVNIDNKLNPELLAKESQGDMGRIIEADCESNQRRNVKHATEPTINREESWSTRWSKCVAYAHAPIKRFLVTVVLASAARPKTTIFLCMTLSMTLLLTGLFTNFSVDVDEDVLWSPKGSRSVSHFYWLRDEAQYPESHRITHFPIHSDGLSVISREGVRKAFEALSTLQGLDEFKSVCGYQECEIESVTKFWNHQQAIFESEILSEEDLRAAISQSYFPDGTRVDAESIMGGVKYNDDNQLIQSAQVLLNRYKYPRAEEVENAERVFMDSILHLRKKWNNDSSNVFKLEMLTELSFPDEFTRALVDDIPLVPIVFGVMSLFTAMTFAKRNPVESRTMLGAGAVVVVLFSIMAGFGLLFICGVNFTSITQILPFVIFGIGLDDAFLITGAFTRLDSKMPIEERLEKTFNNVGVSITLTTMTSALAFGLGCLTSIPAVYWLSLYAFPTILIDFFFQITFFVAILTLDTRRIEQKRWDVIFCRKQKSGEDVSEHSETNSTESDNNKSTLADRFMAGFAERLMHPLVKILVVVASAGLLAGLVYSASLLTQSFDIREVLPSDSYVTSYLECIETYSNRGVILVQLNFRFVNQSNATIQEQMRNYVDDFVSLKQVESPPYFFWLNDFEDFVAGNPDLDRLSFNNQIATFLEVPEFNKAYAADMAISETGDLVASRTWTSMQNVDSRDVTSQIEALLDQRRVGSHQPPNKGRENWSFFSFANIYPGWEFYNQAIDELILTTLVGVASVTGLGMLFVPHWSAGLFICPVISALYVELLGVMQLAGIQINAVSYIAAVMSIGLLVDFILHVLFAYFEMKGSRTSRVKEMLRTTGSSVLIGGISTFLGVLPLAFASSTIFRTIFIAFLGLVVLGLFHGLVVLPVILSLVGPETNDAGIETMETNRIDIPLPDLTRNTTGRLTNDDDSPGAGDWSSEES